MKIERICLLGGTGFVGHHLTARLARDGLACRVVTRHAERHRDLKVTPRLELVEADIMDDRALEGVLGGCDAVVNLVGILNEAVPNESFRRVHIELVDRLVAAARAAGVGRYLHMSALHADQARGSSAYLRSKGEGENRAHTHGGATMQVTSFRPSVIFGPGDSFFNRFAGLLRLLPGPFPLACPDARFAPVFVGDVVEAFARALRDPATWDAHYDLCGPRQLTLRQLVDYTARTIGQRRTIIGLPDWLARLQARVLGHVPGKPFSYDNYLSLQTDSICGSNDLARLGIVPSDIDAVVPAYLAGRSPRGRYHELRGGHV